MSFKLSDIYDLCKDTTPPSGGYAEVFMFVNGFWRVDILTAGIYLGEDKRLFIMIPYLMTKKEDKYNYILKWLYDKHY